MSLLIKNAQIIDGGGGELFRADVLVQGGKISAIGDLKNWSASEAIEGMGNYLAPAFVDIHAHNDHELIFGPSAAQRFRERGIATVVGGNDGFSLAPCFSEVRISRIAGGFQPESAGGINCDWRTAGDLFKSLEAKVGLGLNFGTFLGEETAREAASSGKKSGSSKKDDTDLFLKVIRESLAEGASGVSSRLENGLKSEWRKWLPILSEFGATWSISFGMKDDPEILKSAMETALKAGVKIIVNGHLELLREKEVVIESIAKLISEERRVFWSFNFSDAAALSFSKLIPDWLSSKNGRAIDLLADKKNEIRLERSFSGFDFDRLLVVRAAGHRNLAGKSIRTMSDDLGLRPEEAILYLMRSTKLDGALAYRNEETIRRDELDLFNKENVLISSGDEGVHDVGAWGPLAYLRAAAKKDRFDLAKVIKKLSADPAAALNISGRGLIKEGNWADLVMLNKDDLTLKTIFINGGSVGRTIRLRHV